MTKVKHKQTEHHRISLLTHHCKQRTWENNMHLWRMYVNNLLTLVWRKADTTNTAMKMYKKTTFLFHVAQPPAVSQNIQYFTYFNEPQPHRESSYCTYMHTELYQMPIILFISHHGSKTLDKISWYTAAWTVICEMLIIQQILWKANHHYHTTTVLRPFFRDHRGQPVPEENFWTLWCKGRLTEANTPTIRWALLHPD